ncbi:MAG: fluoride efflux transporter CrcB, partial [bacterium]
MREALQKILIVGAGGFVGANARYWFGMWAVQRFGNAFPWATFLINISGSFLLGFLIVFLMARAPSAEMQNLRLLLAVGFLGAYTTFSTFEYETLALTQSGNIGRAFLNALGSLIAG